MPVATGVDAQVYIPHEGSELLNDNQGKFKALPLGSIGCDNLSAEKRNIRVNDFDNIIKASNIFVPLLSK